MKKQLLLLVALFSLPALSLAADGKNLDETKIKVKTEQGGKWFRALEKKTNSDGELKIKNVLPGKYRFELKNKKDEKANQMLGLDLRLLDEKGRKIRKKTDVEIFAIYNGKKNLMGIVESNKKGEIELSNVMLGMDYEIAVKDDSKVKVKGDEFIVKVKAKIDSKGDWFYSRYSKTDDNAVLTMKDVLPGKYKFKYKKKDRDASLPFALRAKLLTKKGKKIKKATPVEIYAYVGPHKVKTKLMTLETDDHGWIFIPKVMTGEKYKIKVLKK